MNHSTLAISDEEQTQCSPNVQLEFIEGPLKGYNHNLVGCKSLIIGRNKIVSKDFDTLVIDDNFVSRRHLQLTVSTEGLFFFVEDLNSANGTLLNGERLRPNEKQRLSVGDQLVVGTSVLRYNDRDGTEKFFKIPPLTSMAAPSVELPPLQPVTVPPKITSELHPLTLDERSGKVAVMGQELKLSRKQYLLVQYLYRKKGEVCTYSELIKNIWASKTGSLTGAGLIPTPTNVQQLVREIRQKIDQLEVGLSGDKVIRYNPSLRGYQLVEKS
jgi:DNA-binding winged helix-turn-helix (wHTH) protein